MQVSPYKERTETSDGAYITENIYGSNKTTADWKNENIVNLIYDGSPQQTAKNGDCFFPHEFEINWKF